MCRSASSPPCSPPRCGSAAIVTLGGVALVALAFFVAWELTEEQPAVDLSLFARRNFTAGTLALCLGFGAYFGNIVLLPLWLQTRSEEHTSELQSHLNLVCRLLLEKNKLPHE